MMEISSPCDANHVRQLYDHLNRHWWDGELPERPVRWSRRMHASAGKYWHSRVRGWEVVLSDLYHCHFPDEILLTLKHEMVHVWQHVNGLLRPGEAHHGPEFRREAERVGAPRYCKRHPGMHRPLKHEWACPACGRRHWTRIRGTWACRACCDRYNGGRPSRRFQLQRVRTLA